MPNRFSPGVIPRPNSRLGFFGVLAGAGRGVENFVRGRDFVRQREREQGREDEADRIAREEADRAARAEESRQQLHDIVLALRGFQGEQPPREAPVVARGPATESTLRPTFDVPLDLPEFRAGPETAAPASVDDRILGANQGMRPGDVRPSLDIPGAPPQRLELRGGGSIANPAFQSFLAERELASMFLESGEADDIAEAMLMARGELDPLGPQEPPDDFEGAFVEAARTGADLEPLATAGRRFRDAMKFAPFTGGGGGAGGLDAVGRRNRANAVAARLIEEEGMDPDDAAEVAFRQVGTPPDLNAVGDILFDRGRGERRVEDMFTKPQTHLQRAALQAIKQGGLGVIPEIRRNLERRVGLSASEGGITQEQFTQTINWLETDPLDLWERIGRDIARSFSGEVPSSFSGEVPRR